jgi:hypothetical protein
MTARELAGRRVRCWLNGRVGVERWLLLAAMPAHIYVLAVLALDVIHA